MKLPKTSFFIASGTNISIERAINTKITEGSNTNDIPKPKKYKRKKSTEYIPPVEKIKRKITVFKINMLQGPSLIAKNLEFLRLA